MDIFSAAAFDIVDSSDASEDEAEPQPELLADFPDQYDQFITAATGSEPDPKRLRLTRKQAPLPLERLLGMAAVNMRAAAAARGLSTSSFKRLILCGFPLVFLNALTMIETFFPISSSQRTDMSELFSGVAYVAQAWTDNGMKASVLDELRHSLHEDLLSPEGFMSAIRHVRDIKPGGLAHVATVCSTWVYLSRASTGRSMSKPLGFRGSKVTEDANCMAARVSLLLIFMTAIGVWFLHEQPLSSLISCTKMFGWAKNKARTTLQGSWDETFLWMGAYGHDTWKPTQIISSGRWTRSLYKPLTPLQRFMLKPDSGVIHLPHNPSTMKRRISGADGLKSSQAYPMAYGQRVLQLWSDRTEDQPQVIEFSESDSEEEIEWPAWRVAHEECNWKELRLEELVTGLGIPAGRLMP